MRRKPYSVVLFDEIEKAHPDVFNLLLQIMDDGRVTDSLGHRVNFKNTILIMTSNVGARLITREGAMGFGSRDDQAKNYSQMKSVVMEEVKKTFNPEFLNRIDEITVFHSLNAEHAKLILGVMLGRVSKKLQQQGLSIELTEKARDFLVAKGFDQHYGARPLHRTIQRYLEDPLAEAILAKRISMPCTVAVDLDESGQALSINTKAEPSVGAAAPPSSPATA